MYKLKEGVVIRPFGASTKLDAPVTKAVYDWLLSKKLAKASDFEKPKAKKSEAPKTDPPLMDLTLMGGETSKDETTKTK